MQDENIIFQGSSFSEGQEFTKLTIYKENYSYIIKSSNGKELTFSPSDYDYPTSYIRITESDSEIELSWTDKLENCIFKDSFVGIVDLEEEIEKNVTIDKIWGNVCYSEQVKSKHFSYYINYNNYLDETKRSFYSAPTGHIVIKGFPKINFNYYGTGAGYYGTYVDNFYAIATIEENGILRVYKDKKIIREFQNVISYKRAENNIGNITFLYPFLIIKIEDQTEVVFSIINGNYKEGKFKSKFFSHVIESVNYGHIFCNSHITIILSGKDKSYFVYEDILHKIFVFNETLELEGRRCMYGTKINAYGKIVATIDNYIIITKNNSYYIYQIEDKVKHQNYKLSREIKLEPKTYILEKKYDKFMLFIKQYFYFDFNEENVFIDRKQKRKDDHDRYIDDVSNDNYGLEDALDGELGAYWNIV